MQQLERKKQTNSVDLDQTMPLKAIVQTRLERKCTLPVNKTFLQRIMFRASTMRCRQQRKTAQTFSFRSDWQPRRFGPDESSTSIFATLAHWPLGSAPARNNTAEAIAVGHELSTARRQKETQGPRPCQDQVCERAQLELLYIRLYIHHFQPRAA